MRSFILADRSPAFRSAFRLSVVAVLLSASSAYAEPVSTAEAPTQTAVVATTPEQPTRSPTCEALLESAGFQQAALQSIVERRATAQQNGQTEPELDRMVSESQTRLDQTQGQINIACAT